MLDKAETQIGGYFEYSLYDDCWYQNDLIPPTRGFDQTGRKYWGPPPYPSKETIANMLGGAENEYPCGGSAAVFTWVDTKEVKEALHVTEDAYFFSGDNGIGFTYNSTEPNLLPFYRDVV